jgi:hypothetical protein
VKEILSATWIFCVLAMPRFAGAQDTPRGDRQLSVPQQLILIQDAVSNIESNVRQLSPSSHSRQSRWPPIFFIY